MTVAGQTDPGTLGILASEANALLSNASVEAPHSGLKSQASVEIQLLHF